MLIEEVVLRVIIMEELNEIELVDIRLELVGVL